VHKIKFARKKKKPSHLSNTMDDKPYTDTSELHHEGKSSPLFSELPFGDDGTHQHQQASAANTLHLRWVNLQKTVETKDDVSIVLSQRRRKSAGGKGGNIHTKVTPNTKKLTKVILDEVSGEACPGEILAMMVRKQ
jgi:hypothetical protein